MNDQPLLLGPLPNVKSIIHQHLQKSKSLQVQALFLEIFLIQALENPNNHNKGRQMKSLGLRPNLQFLKEGLQHLKSSQKRMKSWNLTQVYQVEGHLKIKDKDLDQLVDGHLIILISLQV